MDEMIGGGVGAVVKSSTDRHWFAARVARAKHALHVEKDHFTR